MTAFSAAAGTVDVTPPPGTPLAGYAARGDAVSTGRADGLEAGLFWLRDEDAGRDVVWIALDAIGVDTELAGAVADAVLAAAGSPDTTVLVCGSHTHSAPAYWFRRPAVQPPLGPEDAAASEGMRAELVERIAGAAATLPARLRPVRLVHAEGPVHGVGANRHRPDGLHDPTAGVLAALDGDGRVLALVTDHGSHPTVLGHANLRWSADWPGAARRALAGALAGLTPFPGADDGAAADAPVVLFLQGAAGCSSARYVRRGQTFAEVDRLGGLYAAQALSALLEAPDAGLAGPLAVGRRMVTLPTKRTLPPDLAAAREEEARAAWEAARAGSPEGGPAERLARTRYEGAVVDRRMAQSALPPTLDLPLTVVAVGDRAWVHVPVELFASWALRIKATSPAAVTRVVGYTDGYLGYLADAEAHRDGVYEAGVSLFDAEAGERLCAAAVDLVHETLGGR